VTRGLGDYPNLLFALADHVDRELRYGTDLAEQLRGIAGELDLLTRSWPYRGP
jgi:hypothetical protein